MMRKCLLSLALAGACGFVLSARAGFIQPDGIVKPEGVDVSVTKAGVVEVRAPAGVEEVTLLWKRALKPETRVLRDDWERTYGKAGWTTVAANTGSPWYVMVERDGVYDGWGVATQPNAFAWWTTTEKGLALTLDLRAGGRAVKLGSRTIAAVRLVMREGQKGESAFAAGRAFCQLMCPSPRLPKAPVYGYNDWYCAYGKNTATNFLADAAFVMSLADGLENRPYVVMDDGWQKNSPPVVRPLKLGASGWGPWDDAGEPFGMKMKPFAAAVAKLGAKPGLWYRPFRAWAEVPDEMKLKANPLYFDPSHPKMRQMVYDDVRRFRSWGMKLVKIDYLTMDVAGGASYADYVGARLVPAERVWRDESRTTVEVLKDLYAAMRAAAGDDMVIIGCNALNHLAAGLFELQRTGGDTSGWLWKQTRNMGVNTLAARSIQDQTFFAVDADCVGLAKAGVVPWEKNSQWLELVSRSGTPLFVSWKKELATDEVRAALKRAFAAASAPRATAEPLDWMATPLPRTWRFADGEKTFDWGEVETQPTIFRLELTADDALPEPPEKFTLDDQYGLKGTLASVHTNLDLLLGEKGRRLALRRGKVAGAESYRVDAGAYAVTLTAEDDEGLRRAIYYFGDRVRAGDLKSVTRRPWLQNRICRSLFDDYPQAYLNRLAHEGFNGIWIPAEAGSLPKEKRDAIVRSCAEYGLKVWFGKNRPNAPGCADLTDAPHALATVPYVPAPGILYRKCRELREAGVTGVLLNRSAGNFTGTMSAAVGELAYEEFKDGETAFLTRLAQPDWGTNAAGVARAWQAMADGYAASPYSDRMEKVGLVSAGIAAPLFPELALTTGSCGDLLDVDLAEPDLRRVIAGFDAALAKMRGAGGADPVAELESRVDPREWMRHRELNLMRALRIQFESARNLLEFYLRRAQAMTSTRDEGVPLACASIKRMRELLVRERDLGRDLARRAFFDSRLGYEASVGAYRFEPARLQRRADQLAWAEGRLIELEALAKDVKPWPLSAHEAAAPEWKTCRYEASGELVIEGPAPKPAATTVTVVLADLGFVTPLYRTTAPVKDGRFTLRVAPSVWQDLPWNRPAWIGLDTEDPARFARLVPAPSRFNPERGCLETNNEEGKVGPYRLEDPCTFADGTKLAGPKDWPKRRKEILEIFAKEMFGQEPPPPEALVCDLESEKVTTGGFAIRRLFKMYFKKDRSGPCVHWALWLPRHAKGKVPVILMLNYRGNFECVTDADISVCTGWSRDSEALNVRNHQVSEKMRGYLCDPNGSTVFPLPMILARGYAVMTASYTEISPDPNYPLFGTDLDLDQYGFATTRGVFTLWGPRDESRTDNVSSIGAWAWTLSRGLDLALKQPEIDPKKTVALGCSRLGKTALLAAARDERFAVCVPNQCGGGGVCLAKRDFGEIPSTEMRYFPHWYCKAYGKYAANPAKTLKFDQHLLVAAIAPRRVLVEGFGPDNWMDTHGEYLACEAASPAWELFGLPGLPKVGYPDFYSTAAIGPYLGYVRRTEAHGIAGYDWQWLMDFADVAAVKKGTH